VIMQTVRVNMVATSPTYEALSNYAKNVGVYLPDSTLSPQNLYIVGVVTNPHLIY
jgi:hypothetical protein